MSVIGSTRIASLDGSLFRVGSSAVAGAELVAAVSKTETAEIIATPQQIHFPMAHLLVHLATDKQEEFMVPQIPNDESSQSSSYL
jgi:hypothetical protein